MTQQDDQSPERAQSNPLYGYGYTTERYRVLRVKNWMCYWEAPGHLLFSLLADCPFVPSPLDIVEFRSITASKLQSRILYILRHINTGRLEFAEYPPVSAIKPTVSGMYIRSKFTTSRHDLAPKPDERKTTRHIEVMDWCIRLFAFEAKQGVYKLNISSKHQFRGG